MKQLCSPPAPQLYPRSILPGAKKPVPSRTDEENIDLSMQLLLQQPQPRVQSFNQDSFSELFKSSGSFLLHRTGSNTESIVVLESSDVEGGRENTEKDSYESLHGYPETPPEPGISKTKQVDLEEIRSPPQIFPEDLRKAKPTEKELYYSEAGENLHLKPRKLPIFPRKRYNIDITNIYTVFNFTAIFYVY